MNCSCHHRINICHQHIPTPSLQATGPVSSPSQQQIDNLTRKYSLLMESQLAQLSAAKQEQIDELNKLISALNMKVSKLEARNSLDQKSEKELRAQLSRQADRIRDLQAEVFNLQKTSSKKETIKEIVKEVIVRVPAEPNRQQLDEERNRSTQTKALLLQKQALLQENNAKAAAEIKWLNQKILSLQSQLESLEGILQKKDHQLERMRNDLKFLEEKIEIVSKPTSYNIEPVVLTRVEHQPPQIHTIYADRAVREVQYVEVEKIVNHLIQPERPIVNRIIQCEGSSGKKRPELSDDQNDSRAEEELTTTYEGVIRAYKDERQGLVKQIRERDHDYHLLTKQIELCNKIKGSKGQSRGDPSVEVTVFKHDGRQKTKTEEVSQKTSAKVTGGRK